MGPGLKPQALLLAAGRGRRAGGPKAWRELDGKPALERQLDALAGLVEETLVSVQSGWLARLKPRAGARFVAVDPDLPALASIQTLLAARSSERPALLHHVDMAELRGPLVAALADALGGGDAAVPIFEGRRGHPVLLCPALFAPILALDPAADRLDVFLRGRRVVEVPTPDGAVLENRN